MGQRLDKSWDTTIGNQLRKLQHGDSHDCEEQDDDGDLHGYAGCPSKHNKEKLLKDGHVCTLLYPLILNAKTCLVCGDCGLKTLSPRRSCSALTRADGRRGVENHVPMSEFVHWYEMECSLRT